MLLCGTYYTIQFKCHKESGILSYGILKLMSSLLLIPLVYDFFHLLILFSLVLFFYPPLMYVTLSCCFYRPVPAQVLQSILGFFHLSSFSGFSSPLLSFLRLGLDFGPGLLSFILEFILFSLKLLLFTFELLLSTLELLMSSLNP